MKDSAMLRGKSWRWALALLAILLILTMAPFLASQNPPDAVDLQIIVVDSRAQAQEVVERLQRGEDFAKLAREKSTDPTASDGGHLGRLEPSSLHVRIRAALPGVAPGQLTPIIELPGGYAVLKVLEKAVPVAGMGTERNQLPLAGPDNVQYVLAVSGFIEVGALVNRIVKPAGWERNLQAICEVKKQAVGAGSEQVQRFLAAANREGLSARNARHMEDAYFSFGLILAYQGKLDQAIDQWQSAYKIAASHFPAEVPTIDEVLGAGYLQQAGLENSVFHDAHGGCLFPMRPEARFRKTANIEKAIEHFSKYLNAKPDDLEVRWLLNLAYMNLGKYPAAVPKQFLIPPAALESKEDIGRFKDVAPAMGLKIFDMAGGMIVDDFDNDGLLDVVTSSMEDCAPMHFFHNNGDGTFTERTRQAGLSDQLGGLSMIQTDYNNDGCLDILVLRGGWEVPKRKSLLKGHCDGTFTDVTRESGLASAAVSASQTAVWTDIDNDGDLDLFVGSENTPSQLFLNKGDGTFEEISHAAGVDRTAFTKAVVAGDYDNDGYPDLYVSNFNGENFLYHNNRNRTFTDVGRALGVEKPLSSFPAWFFDYDNDGWLDIFVASYVTSVDETARDYLHLPGKGETLKLYRNMGNGTFRDVTKEAGLNRAIFAMGSGFGDLDNDGFLDIYLGTGNPSFAALTPNALFRNHDGKSFVDITASSGTGCLHKGHGVAFADINNDGHEDLFIQTGGAVPSDKHATMLFKNPGNGNDWISMKLVGVKSNRAALGARIKVTVVNERGQRRFVQRVVGSGGSFGASPFQQHLGLGKAARIESVEVWWPASGTRQTFHNLDKNQFIEIKEFEKAVTKMARKPFAMPEGGMAH
ncbi:MAG: VCBS repeat-containing protein [Candidatus Solibacter usitatus]|nr:VCBS repeat-containing protein [Candidatus Solibacter usitatus]